MKPGSGAAPALLSPADLAEADVERALLEPPRIDRHATPRTLLGHADLLT